MLCLLFAVSCNEEPSDTTNITKGPNNYNSQSAWSNANNPYDTAGDYHNQGLDYIISFRDYFDCNDSLVFYNQIVGYSADYTCSYNWYQGSGTCNDYAESVFNDINSARENLTVNQLIDSFAVDKDSKSEMSDLISIVENFTDSNNINLLYNAIKVWEYDVINSNYSLDCKLQLLVSSSVMRYSLHYWNEQRLLGELSYWVSPCGNIINNKNGRISGNFQNIVFWEEAWDIFVGVVATAAADAVGGYIGLVGGSWAGPGAIYIAIGSGAFASTAAACLYPW